MTSSRFFCSNFSFFNLGLCVKLFFSNLLLVFQYLAFFFSLLFLFGVPNFFSCLWSWVLLFLLSPSLFWGLVSNIFFLIFLTCCLSFNVCRSSFLRSCLRCRIFSCIWRSVFFFLLSNSSPVVAQLFFFFVVLFGFSDFFLVDLFTFRCFLLQLG